MGIASAVLDHSVYLDLYFSVIMSFRYPELDWRKVMRRAEASAKYQVVSTSPTSRRDFEIQQMWSAAHESLHEEMQSLLISDRHRSSLEEILETRFRKWRAKYWENACREMDEQFEHSEKENEVLKKEVSQLHRHSSDLMDQIQRMELDRQAYEVLG